MYIRFSLLFSYQMPLFRYSDPLERSTLKYTIFIQDDCPFLQPLSSTGIRDSTVDTRTYFRASSIEWGKTVSHHADCLFLYLKDLQFVFSSDRCAVG